MNHRGFGEHLKITFCFIYCAYIHKAKFPFNFVPCRLLFVRRRRRREEGKNWLPNSDLNRKTNRDPNSNNRRLINIYKKRKVRIERPAFTHAMKRNEQKKNTNKSYLLLRYRFVFSVFFFSFFPFPPLVSSIEIVESKAKSRKLICGYFKFFGMF